jgi:hypothetical protein
MIMKRDWIRILKEVVAVCSMVPPRHSPRETKKKRTSVTMARNCTEISNREPPEYKYMLCTNTFTGILYGRRTIKRLTHNACLYSTYWSSFAIMPDSYRLSSKEPFDLKVV